MIKIIFFDIDGTLLKLGATQVSPIVKEALFQCKRNGIKLFIATGRPKFVVPDLGIPFDGYLTFNGQYCFNSNEIIYQNPIQPEDVQTIIENAKKMNEPLVLAGCDKMGSNYQTQNLKRYFEIANQTIQDLDDFENFSKQNIYQIMAGITKEKDEELLTNCKNTVITRWWPYACDIIPKNGGKEIGIQKILDYYHYTKEECMAFGDGGNDQSMLEYVGIGIAMGNATKDVKEIADHVTDSVEKDGIFSALKYFNLIE